MCKEVAPNLPPVEVTTSADLGLGLSWPVKQVVVTYKRKPDDEYGYAVLSVREVKKK